MARILVIDDELILRQLFERVLRSEGHEVVVAANGREGLMMMNPDAPDLILLDLVMPVMDGMSFLRSMRRRAEWTDIPVIVVSGVLDRHQVLQVKELGVVDYMLKAGFEMGELRARLAKHLPKPRKPRGQGGSSLKSPAA
jgi:DNA-binding response OmpR family regulator